MSRAGSNRTFMELKLTNSSTVDVKLPSSNRTFMELKSVIGAHCKGFDRF